MATLKNRPEVRKSVEELYWLLVPNMNWPEEIDLERIAEEYGVPSGDVMNYLESYKFVAQAQNTVTVFYNERRWVKGEPCFDLRYGSQMLPRESVVCGFLTCDGLGVVDPPYTREAQKANFEVILKEALSTLGLIDHKFEETPGPRGPVLKVVEE